MDKRIWIKLDNENKLDGCFVVELAGAEVNDIPEKYIEITDTVDKDTVVLLESPLEEGEAIFYENNAFIVRNELALEDPVDA